MEQGIRYASAPLSARRLIVLSWIVITFGSAWFWLKGDPHDLFWLPIFVFLLLQCAAGGLGYQNHKEDPSAADLANFETKALPVVLGCVFCGLLLFICFFPPSAHPGNAIASAILVVSFSLPAGLWLYHDFMLLIGRYKLKPEESAAPTPEGMTDKERFVAATLGTRLLIGMSSILLIGGIWWLAASPAERFDSFYTILVFYTWQGLVSLARWMKYSDPPHLQHSGSARLLRGIAMVVVGVAGVLVARWLFEVSLAVSMDSRGAYTFGKAWLTLTCWALLSLIIARSILYPSAMIIIGWDRLDIVAEKAEESAKLRPPPEPQPTCAECGLTFRPGRTRCHFCGGPPAPETHGRG